MCQQVVAAGLPGTTFSEHNMLPLGFSNGVALYLDGSRSANFDRSDMNLGWCVKVAKGQGEKPSSGDKGKKGGDKVKKPAVKMKDFKYQGGNRCHRVIKH
jgi:hypothetical protein